MSRAMSNRNPGAPASAETLFRYLAVRDPEPEPADLAVGFGHFDPKIPVRCCELYRRGYARRLLLTGGVGARTADLAVPEAVYFRDEIRRLCPEIPADRIFIESASTHTGENVVRSIQLLRKVSPAYNLDRGMSRAILIANAYRQRRVGLTWRHHLPHVKAFNAPPRTTFEREWRMFADRGIDFFDLLVGEVDRIIRYGERGYFERVQVPAAVMQARDRLCDLGYGNGVPGSDD